jgi:hypothetical protein
LNICEKGAPVIRIKTLSVTVTYHVRPPTIALAPDGEIDVATEKKYGISGALSEERTAVPDRDVVLCIPVWLLELDLVSVQWAEYLITKWSTYQIV